MSGIAWLPWSADGFARARAERKLVLLSITAAWCCWCDEMDQTSYADPAVADFISDRFVPIRIDADRRPDISERYNLGGWPTTAFLTAEGDIVGGGTYVARDKMLGMLQQVAHVFAERHGELPAPALAPEPEAAAAPGDPRAVSLERLCGLVFDGFDAEHGGFGEEPKFPLTAPVHLALDLFRETEDARLAAIAVRTLDAIGWGELHDDVDGGFFRCAATRAWRMPHLEKLLDVNAKLLALFVHAGQALELARFTERAADVLRYVQTWLADPADGGWAGSQRADAVYYSAHDAASRRLLTAPPIDAAFYADSNAAMASAFFRAAAAFEDDGLRDFAVKSLERVVLACYKPGSGVAHYMLDGRADVRGLLEDQIAMAGAHLDAYDATGNIVYEMMAEELVHYAAGSLWDSRAGGFFDRAGDGDADVGLLRRPLKPFVGNCEAARVLTRLSKASGDSEFARLASATIQAMAPMAEQQGPIAAHFVLAMRELSLK
jgi:uncharacterized protein YyaL (SSP411 family)